MIERNKFLGFGPVEGRKKTYKKRRHSKAQRLYRNMLIISQQQRCSKLTLLKMTLVLSSRYHKMVFDGMHKTTKDA